MSLAGSVRPGAFAATGVLQSLSETGSKRARLETQKDKRVLETFVALSKQGWRLAGEGRGSPTGEGIHLRGVGLMVPPVEKPDLGYLKDLSVIEKNIALTDKARRLPPHREKAKVVKNGKTYWAIIDKDTGRIVETSAEAAPTSRSVKTQEFADGIYQYVPESDSWKKVGESPPDRERRDPQWLVRLRESIYNRIYNSMRISGENKAGYDVIHGLQEALDAGGFELHERTFKIPSDWRSQAQRLSDFLGGVGKNLVKNDEITMYLVMPKGIEPHDTDWLRMLETQGGMNSEDAVEMVQAGEYVRKPIKPPVGKKRRQLTPEQYREAKKEGWTDEEIIAQGMEIPR